MTETERLWLELGNTQQRLKAAHERIEELEKLAARMTMQEVAYWQAPLLERIATLELQLAAERMGDTPLVDTDSPWMVPLSTAEAELHAFASRTGRYDGNVPRQGELAGRVGRAMREALRLAIAARGAR